MAESDITVVSFFFLMVLVFSHICKRDSAFSSLQYIYIKLRANKEAVCGNILCVHYCLIYYMLLVLTSSTIFTRYLILKEHSSQNSNFEALVTLSFQHNHSGVHRGMEFYRV